MQMEAHNSEKAAQLKEEHRTGDLNNKISTSIGDINNASTHSPHLLCPKALPAARVTLCNTTLTMTASGETWSGVAIRKQHHAEPVSERQGPLLHHAPL